MTLSLELKNLWGKARQEECGWINIDRKSSRISLVKMYVGTIAGQADIDQAEGS
jgi:hypothetical protein